MNLILLRVTKVIFHHAFPFLSSLCKEIWANIAQKCLWCPMLISSHSMKVSRLLICLTRALWVSRSGFLWFWICPMTSARYKWLYKDPVVFSLMAVKQNPKRHPRNVPDSCPQRMQDYSVSEWHQAVIFHVIFPMLKKTKSLNVMKQWYVWLDLLSYMT